MSTNQSLKTGDRHYRAFVGPHQKYDLVGAMQFNLLTLLGLRDHHHLLDIGCGSLRAGRLFIPYLLPDRYFGIEPEQWLIDEGIENEIGADQIRLKRPTFNNSTDFDISSFKQQFDFILAQSIFTHTSQDQMSRCLQEVKQNLKSGGIFVASYISGTSNYTGTEWVYPGTVSYTPQFMAELIRQHDLSYRAIDWIHPNRHSWLAIVHSGQQRKVPPVSNRAFYYGSRHKRADKFLARIYHKVTPSFLKNFLKGSWLRKMYDNLLK